MRLRLPSSLLVETFEHFRKCGCGKRECQMLWVGPWADPLSIERAIHPQHVSTASHIRVDDDWINSFWMALADEGIGVRAQVHTHPASAYHSTTDDEFPVIHTPGFLSLVIPNFALGPIGFQGAYLAQRDERGGWREVNIADHLEVIDDR